MIWMFLLKKAAKKTAKKAAEKAKDGEGKDKKADPGTAVTGALLDGLTSLSCCFVSLIISAIIFLFTMLL